MEKADDTKRAIIESVLGWIAMPERPPLPGAKGLRNLVSAAGGKATPAADG